MLNDNRGGADGLTVQIRNGINGRMAEGNVTDGSDAARRTIELMRTIRMILSPERIVEVWDEVGGPSSPDYEKMWQKLGVKTGQCMAEGALLLASLWQSAWELGEGDQHIHTDNQINYTALRNLFEPNGTPGHGHQFLPSLWLSEYPY
jgi:hypothetical protein